MFAAALNIVVVVDVVVWLSDGPLLLPMVAVDVVVAVVVTWFVDKSIFD